MIPSLWVLVYEAVDKRGDEQTLLTLNQARVHYATPREGGVDLHS